MADADPTPLAKADEFVFDSLPELKLDQRHLMNRKIVGLNSGDRRSRAFNLLRTSLLKRLKGPIPRLVGITSATPAAGKSFLSVNLALSLAKVADGPVILVDLDLHRGSIAEELGLNPRPGVADFLLGDAGLREIGIRVEGLPLAVLSTKVIAQGSAELLVGDRFIHLVRSLREQPADTVVLVDLPPVFANDDAMLSVGQLDGYILVVDSTQTSKAHVQEAVSLLAPAPCIGTILNRYSGAMFDKYGYGSGAYGKYFEI